MQVGPAEIQQKKEQLTKMLSNIEKGVETKEILSRAYTLATELKGEILKDKSLQEKVKNYLFPYAINKRASKIVKAIKEAEVEGKEAKKRLQAELIKKYGEYVGQCKNDCYDFLMHITGEAAVEMGVISKKEWGGARKWKVDGATGRRYLVTSFSSDVRYGERIGRGEGSSYPLKELDKRKIALKPSSFFIIQSGCFVYVNYSPVTGKKADHWAIYTDEGLLMNRGGKFLAKPFEWFFSTLEKAPEEERDCHIYHLFGTRYKSVQKKVVVVEIVNKETGKREKEYKVGPATNFDRFQPLEGR